MRRQSNARERDEAGGELRSGAWDAPSRDQNHNKPERLSTDQTVVSDQVQRQRLGAAYTTSLTPTNLPMRPRSRNSTTPVTRAKRVSSLPQPTFSPGLMRVPRWRTMIDPPGTNCPPKTFTPSRCALESRPFLELPSPFLCAMNDSCSYAISLI